MKEYDWRSLKSQLEVKTGDSKCEDMEGGKIRMEIDLIAIACLYHLQKSLAVHVAENRIALIGFYPMRCERQVESSSFWALNRLQIGVFLDVIEVIPLLIEHREILGQPNPLESDPLGLIHQRKYINPSDRDITTHLESNTKEANSILAQSIFIPKQAGAQLIAPRRISKQVPAPRKTFNFPHCGSIIATEYFNPLQKVCEPIISSQSKYLPLLDCLCLFWWKNESIRYFYFFGGMISSQPFLQVQLLLQQLQRANLRRSVASSRSRARLNSYHRRRRILDQIFHQYSIALYISRQQMIDLN